jgi:hypothetical protein
MLVEPKVHQTYPKKRSASIGMSVERKRKSYQKPRRKLMWFDEKEVLRK